MRFGSEGHKEQFQWGWMCRMVNLLGQTNVLTRQRNQCDTVAKPNLSRPEADKDMLLIADQLEGS